MAIKSVFGSILGLLIVVLSTAGCSGSDHTADESSGEFFLQLAQAGSIEMSQGTGTLTLQGTSPNLIWVSDRPQRTTGDLSIESFASTWEQTGFGEDPPNAIVTSHTRDLAGVEPIVLELTDPSLDRAAETMTYSITAIDDPERSESRSIQDIALFIDSGGASIYLTVVKADGAPPTEILIFLECDCADPAQYDYLDGTTALSDLNVGYWTISATSPGYEPNSVGVDLTAADGPQDVSMLLCPSDSTGTC